MKIASVKATWVSVPIPPARQHASDYGRLTRFDTVLVRVRADSGLEGIGEAKAAVASQGDGHALAALIERELGPRLVGEDARDINRLWETMYSGARAHYALERGRAFPVLGRRGLTISALSGIDIALWDLLGKHLGQPVWRLLGGRCRETLPAYASGGWAGVEGIGEELGGYVARGFRAVKMRVGAKDGEAAVSAKRVAAARRALGEEIAIFCDAHGTWTVAEAKRFCRLAADCNVGWLEEPVSPDDRRGHAEVRAATDIPIAAGESEFTRFDFAELAALRAVDVFQPDLAICGGITEALRIAALAAAHQVRLAPHMWGGAIMFAAGLQVCAVSPAAYIVEYSLGHNPLMHELTEERFAVKDGRVAIPERPGLGLTLVEDFVARHAVIPDRE